MRAFFKNCYMNLLTNVMHIWSPPLLFVVVVPVGLRNVITAQHVEQVHNEWSTCGQSQSNGAYWTVKKHFNAEMCVKYNTIKRENKKCSGLSCNIVADDDSCR
jgi:hypothetical protein